MIEHFRERFGMVSFTNVSPINAINITATIMSWSLGHDVFGRVIHIYISIYVHIQIYTYINCRIQPPWIFQYADVLWNNFRDRLKKHHICSEKPLEGKINYISALASTVCFCRELGRLRKNRC